MNLKEPIVLGQLKKEKSSKPIFVLLVFALLIGTCFGLPSIKKYLATNENDLTRFYHTYIGKYFDDDVVVDNSKKEDNDNNKTSSDIKLIDDKTILVKDSITVSDIKINNNTITYSVSASINTYLDLVKYYIELYDENTSLIGRVKLTGLASSNNITNTQNLAFNVNSSVYGKMVLLNDDDYPDVNIERLVCKYNDNIYTYNFSDNKLRSIYHEYTFTNLDDLNVYVDSLNNSRIKSAFINNFINSSSATTEIDNGYRFTAYLDLSHLKISDLKEYIDYNYYNLDTLSKTVKYELESKGLDCA